MKLIAPLVLFSFACFSIAAQAERRPVPSGNGAMSEPERIAVQFDLAWTGDYTGVITGTRDDNEKTAAAIRSFQRNHRINETGVLTAQDRALLAGAAKAKQTQVGWAIVEDAATGARLGIPAKQVPNKAQGRFGTRWSSAQGQVVIETFKVREPGTTLASVYEQQRKEPATRRLEGNVLRPDFFVLSGMQGLKRFYVRGDFKDGEVRGVTVLYDQATENIMDPAAVIIASSFSILRHRAPCADRSLVPAQGGVRHRHRGERVRPHSHHSPFRGRL